MRSATKNSRVMSAHGGESIFMRRGIDIEYAGLEKRKRRRTEKNPIERACARNRSIARMRCVHGLAKV